MNSTKYNMINQILNDENLSSINIFGVQLKSIVNKLRTTELQEIILNIPHVKNEENPSWFDLFISTRERGIIIQHSVTKKQMKKLLENKKIEDMLLDELLNQSPNRINLRILASKFGYCSKSGRFSQHEYCQILGLPRLEYGYQVEVMLLAKYLGFVKAESLPSRQSFEFLGMQPYPKTINELADIDETRFNHDVILASEFLKTVIQKMHRTYLVKIILAKYVGYKFSSKMTGKELDKILF